MCGDGLSVSGFLLNNRVCGSNGAFSALDYHSVGEFRDWIEQVSGAENFAKMSPLLILSAVLINAKKNL